MASKSATDERSATVVTRGGIADTPTELTPPPGSSWARYVLLERLGEGGMGTVVRAYDPKLRREVALKRLRAEALGDDAHTRMVREAQAMARLNHPNVVAVYDVELLDDRVIIVMEYVPGTTLRGWLSLSSRSWEEVVSVFVQAGRGLWAAHRAGMVHRDFKPSNVLVTDELDVKVGDFGLAKGGVEGTPSSDSALALASASGVLPQSLDSVDLDAPLTQSDVVLGTPRYMAPEQQRGTPTDARADQYAFCVALWEALAGAPPFASARGRDKRRGPPPWPGPSSVPPSIVEAIRRGLAFEPAQRWPTMDPLLEILERSPGRRRRSRAQAWMSVGALATVGVAIYGVQAHRGQRCVGAETQLDGVWDDERRAQVHAALLTTGVSHAEQSATNVETVLDAWADAWVDEHREACEATTVRGEQSPMVMDLRMACLHDARTELAAVVDVLAQADGDVVHEAVPLAFGLTPPSRCGDIAALDADVPPPDAAVADEVAHIRTELATVDALQGAGKYADARALAIPLEERADATGYVPLRVELNLVLGRIQQGQADYDGAEQLLHDALQQGLTVGAMRDASAAASQLAFVVGQRRARHAEGQWLAEVAVGLARNSDPRSPTEATALLELSGLLQARGQYEEARQTQRQALAMFERTLGPDHPRVATSLHNLANIHWSLAEYDEAQRLHARALAILERALGPDHPDVAAGLNSLAAVAMSTGRYDDAQEIYERALVIRKRALGPDHPSVAVSLNNLAVVHHLRGDLDAARPLYADATRIFEHVHGSAHPDVATGLNNLATIDEAKGALDQALALHERALAVRGKALGDDHPDVASSLDNLGAIHEAKGEYARSEELRGRALRIWEAALGREHPSVSYALAGLASVALAQHRTEEAVELAERTLAIREHTDVPSAKLHEAQLLLARALWEEGTQRPRARELARRARDGYRELAPAEAAALADVEAWLAGHR